MPVTVRVPLHVSEQYYPKAKTRNPRAHDKLIPRQTLTQNSHSRSVKVIYFGVSEKPLRDYVLQHNNCGVICESSQDITSAENRHFRRPHSHLTPHLQRTPTKCAWRAPKNVCNVTERIMALQLQGQFKVNQRH